MSLQSTRNYAGDLADALEQQISEHRQWADEAEVILNLLRKAPAPVALTEFRSEKAPSPQPRKATAKPLHFPQGMSAEYAIVDFIIERGRTWKANDLRDYLLEHSNLTEVVNNPQSCIYQALSRGVKRGLLVRVKTGVYGPADPPAKNRQKIA